MKKSKILILSFMVCSSLWACHATAQIQQKSRADVERFVQLQAQVTDLDYQQAELVRQYTEAVTFVADYESFNAKDKTTQNWLKAKADLYRRSKTFDEQLRDLGNNHSLPLHQLSHSSSMSVSNLLSTLAGVSGGFFLIDGLFEKNQYFITLGVAIVGTVIAVNVTPKFVQATLHDQIADVEYIESGRSEFEIKAKYEEFKYQKIPELNGKIQQMEENRNHAKENLASLH